MIFFRLKQNDIERLSRTIEQAESKTVGEIVAMIVPSSRHYRWVHLLWVLIGIFTASTAVRTAETWKGIFFSLDQILSAQLLGASVFGLLSLIPPLKRLTLPRPLMRRCVEQRCWAAFVEKGLTQTQERSGVLVFVSVFERQVHILADQGIHARVPEGYWKPLADQLAQGLRTKAPIDAFCQILEEIGKKLSQEFPAKGGHHNQLPNRPILEE